MAKKEARFAAGFFRYGNKKLRVGDYVLGTACWGELRCYRPEAAWPACRSLLASTFASYCSTVRVVIVVVVSPRWMVCAVVVTVRVTLQLDRSRARATMTSRMMAAMASNCFLLGENIIYKFTNS